MEPRSVSESRGWIGAMASAAVITAMTLFFCATLWVADRQRAPYEERTRYSSPQPGGPIGLGAGSPVTGDGTYPTGKALPMSATGTDRASGPAAGDGVTGRPGSESAYL